MTVNPHQSLIQAICNRDIATIEKFMDDDILHFQAEKSVAIPYLKGLFERWGFSQGGGTIAAKEISCHKCRDVYGNEVIHNHVVLFEIQRVSFAFDLLPTKDGLYRLDNCGTFQEFKIKGQSYFKFPIYIPLDLLPSYIPDAGYLRLMSEQEDILSQIDNGQVVFWFVEDLTAWIDKYEQTKIDMFNQGTLMEAFKKTSDILFMMEYLNDGLIAENECKIANELFDKLNQADVWGIYEWLEKHRRFDYVSISPSELNLDYVHEGYFTFKDFLPNLRFSVYGHTEFLKCIHNMDLAYKVTEEIRRDRLLEDIEDEWYWEDDEEGPELSDQYYLDSDEG